MTENPYDNFDWKLLLTLMAYGSVPVVGGFLFNTKPECAKKFITAASVYIMKQQY